MESAKDAARAEVGSFKKLAAVEPAALLVNAPSGRKPAQREWRLSRQALKQISEQRSFLKILNRCPMVVKMSGF